MRYNLSVQSGDDGQGPPYVELLADTPREVFDLMKWAYATGHTSPGVMWCPGGCVVVRLALPEVRL